MYGRAPRALASRFLLVCFTKQGRLYTSGCMKSWYNKRPRHPHLTKNIKIWLYTLKDHHNADLIGLPSNFVSCSHRQGISLILARISSIEIRFHSSRIISFSCFSVCHSRLLTRCFKMFHIPLCEFKSGD